MRKLRKPGSAGLAGLVLALLAACGGGPSSPDASASPAATCVNASAPHRAHVVVEHLSGAAQDRCVGFSTGQLAGDQLMKQSGLAYQTQHFSFGDAVCAIDGEPATFDTCLPQGAPYWALWTETAGGSWQQAQVGFTDVQLGDGDALGWRYTPATEVSPSPPTEPKK
jgi:hypothetical protein